MNALVPVSEKRLGVSEKILYASKLSEAGLLPKSYFKQPGNCFLAVELGESLGIPPITAINLVHVIDGKPSASSALISALVRRAGHRLRVTGDDTKATCQIVRKDDPDFTFTSTWTLERARNAGLTGKGVWKSYPAAMLKARAITECARDACQEALCGVQYTPEELGHEVDSNEEPIMTAQVVEVSSEPVQASKTNDSRRTNPLMARLNALRTEMDAVHNENGLDKEGSAAMSFDRFRKWVEAGLFPADFPTENGKVAVAKFTGEQVARAVELYEAEKAKGVGFETETLVDDAEVLS